MEREAATHLTPPEEDKEGDPAFKSRLHPEGQEEEEVHMGTIEIRNPLETLPPKHHRPRAWGDIRERAAAVDPPWVTVFNPDYPAPKWSILK